MTKRLLSMAAAICTVCLLLQMPVRASDAEGEDYITISVDAIDNSGSLKYALDTDDPSAFTESNEFVVPAGTSHTIYVKDAAGNISSQVYEGSGQPQRPYNYNVTEDEQKVNIDLELGGSKPATTNYGGNVTTGEPAESGSATVSSKVITDGSENSERIFYTFTTKEGEVLYLVVDQGQGTDNVYLLDTVSIGDLKVLADGNASASGDDTGQKDNLLSALSAQDNDTNENISDQNQGKTGKTASNKNTLIILVLAVIGGGVYYYLKVYKNKKDDAMDAMDAMDLDEFAPEEEEEEIDFDYDDSEKEKYLEQLINEEEDFFEADPEDYATSHMGEEDYDDGIEIEEDTYPDAGDYADTDNGEENDEEAEES